MKLGVLTIGCIVIIAGGACAPSQGEYFSGGASERGYRVPPPIITSPEITSYSTSSTLVIEGLCNDDHTVWISGEITEADLNPPRDSLTASCIEGEFQLTIEVRTSGTYIIHLRQIDQDGIVSEEAATLQWEYENT
jgi:hypothetical protein